MNHWSINIVSDCFGEICIDINEKIADIQLKYKAMYKYGKHGNYIVVEMNVLIC